MWEGIFLKLRLENNGVVGVEGGEMGKDILWRIVVYPLGDRKPLNSWNNNRWTAFMSCFHTPISFLSLCILSQNHQNHSWAQLFCHPEFIHRFPGDMQSSLGKHQCLGPLLRIYFVPSSRSTWISTNRHSSQNWPTRVSNFPSPVIGLGFTRWSSQSQWEDSEDGPPT